MQRTSILCTLILCLFADTAAAEITPATLDIITTHYLASPQQQDIWVNQLYDILRIEQPNRLALEMVDELVPLQNMLKQTKQNLASLFFTKESTLILAYQLLAIDSLLTYLTAIINSCDSTLS